MDRFITIEGCEGVGKTEQNRLLKQYCVDNGLDVVFTREPGGSKVAEKIRDIILDASNTEICDMCEAFLYASARVQHLHDVVIPALNAGKTVLCDRYVDSSYAYQGYARGLGYERVRLLNSLAIGNYIPQYTIFLDLSPDKAFARKGGVDKADRLEVQGMELHRKVYQGYMSVIADNPERFIVIDASGTKQQTHEKILRALRLRGVIV